MFMNEESLALLEERIGYRFADRSYLVLALTHSSYAHESGRLNRGSACNERLEFLGDAVLELMTSEYLYAEHGEMAEGKLSKLRASIVCEPSLAICARDIGLGAELRLGHGEEMTGAIYLDGGAEPARAFVQRFVLSNLSKEQLFVDAKTVLQELCQQMFKCEPVYSLVREDGPAHCREFTMSCAVDRYTEEAVGRSKKSAEQACAQQMLRRLRELR